MLTKSGYTPLNQVGYGTTSIAVQNRRTGNMEISEIGSLTKKGDRK